MSGYSFISAACLRLSSVLARMNSWSRSPSFEMTNFICSPRCTTSDRGVYPMPPFPSWMLMLTVRNAFVRSPGSPAEKCSPLGMLEIVFGTGSNRSKAPSQPSSALPWHVLFASPQNDTPSANAHRKRRDFIIVLVGAAACTLAARAQEPRHVVGYLSSFLRASGSSEALPGALAAFYQGLKETGFAEGRNIGIEFRWADGHYDRLPGLAADLVGRGVPVICAVDIPSAFPRLRSQPPRSMIDSPKPAHDSETACPGPLLLKTAMGHQRRWRVLMAMFAFPLRSGPKLTREIPRLCRGGSKSLTFPAVVPQAPIGETSSVSRRGHEQSSIDGRPRESVGHRDESAKCYAAFVPKYRRPNCTRSCDTHQDGGASVSTSRLQAADALGPRQRPQ
jgi:hypothetical protein